MFIPFFIFVSFFVSGLILDRMNIPLEKKIRYFLQWCNFSMQKIGGIQFILDDPIPNKTKVSEKTKILVTANHPGMTDMFSIFWFHNTQFPNHTPIFILDKRFVSIPIFGKYYKNFNIPIGKGVTEEEMEKSQKLLQEYPFPFVLYLFPEGTTMCKETFTKSKQTKDGQNLDYLLLPRTKAFQWFSPYCDAWLDLTLWNEGRHAEYISSFFMGMYPHTTHFSIQNISRDLKRCSDHCSFLRELWKKKDSFLSSKKNLFLEGFQRTFDFFHGVLLFYHILLIMFQRSPLCVGTAILFLLTCWEQYFFKRHYWLNKISLGFFVLTHLEFISMFHILMNFGATI